MLIDRQFMKMLNMLIRNESLAKSQIKLQVLPAYSPETYGTPIEVDWFDYANYATTRTYGNWTRQMSNHDHSRCMDLLRMMLVLLGKEKIAFTLTHGTLLGSLRHLDLVPWDDDVDIIVDSAYIDRVRSAVTRANWDLAYVNISNYIKVFHKSSPEVKAGTAKYPFVDVFFYTRNRTHLLGSLWGVKSAYRQVDFYPLKLRPLGKYWFPVPHNPSKVLEGTRITNFRTRCMFGGFNHKNSTKRKIMNVNCSQLKGYHLFTEEHCMRGKEVN